MRVSKLRVECEMGKHYLRFSESSLGIALFLEGKAFYDLTSFFVKIIQLFSFDTLNVMTLSIQQEGTSDFLSVSAPSPG